MLTPRHNEHWPKGYVTVFCANEHGAGVFFGTFEQAKAVLKAGELRAMQYVCFNSADFAEVEEIFAGCVDGDPPG